MVTKSKLAGYANNLKNETSNVGSEPLTGWEDGLYSLTFVLEGGRGDEFGDALAVLRDGRLLGSDKHGGVFEGQLSTTRCGSASCLALTMRVPPGGVLVTGQHFGGKEAMLDVVGVLSHIGGEMNGVCDLFGERLAIQFRYVGDLPH